MKSKSPITIDDSIWESWRTNTVIGKLLHRLDGTDKSVISEGRELISEQIWREEGGIRFDKIGLIESIITWRFEENGLISWIEERDIISKLYYNIHEINTFECENSLINERIWNRR